MSETPMTPDTAMARLRQYGERTKSWSTATHNDGTERALHQIATTLSAEIERLRAELEPYEVLNPQQCPKGVHADWLVDSEHAHACPWCEVDRLQNLTSAWRDQLIKVEDFCAKRAEYITAIVNCRLNDAADYHRWQGHAESRRELSELMGLPTAWPAGHNAAGDSPAHHTPLPEGDDRA